MSNRSRLFESILAMELGNNNTSGLPNNVVEDVIFGWNPLSNESPASYKIWKNQLVQHARNVQNAKDARNAKHAKDAKKVQNAKNAKDAKKVQNAKDAKNVQNAREKIWQRLNQDETNAKTNARERLNAKRIEIGNKCATHPIKSNGYCGYRAVLKAIKLQKGDINTKPRNVMHKLHGYNLTNLTNDGKKKLVENYADAHGSNSLPRKLWAEIMDILTMGHQMGYRVQVYHVNRNKRLTSMNDSRYLYPNNTKLSIIKIVYDGIHFEVLN